MSSINLSTIRIHMVRHGIAYVLALTMGILCVAPYAYFATTPEYRGIALMGQDAEEHYLARIQAAYEGDYAMGSIFMPNKDVPYLMPALGEIVVAQLGQMLDMAAPTINIVTKVLFPTGIFLLIYVFAFSIGRSRSVALLAAGAGMLGTAIMSNPRELLALIQGTSIVDGITWARPINPPFSGLMLFGSLWMMYRARNRVPRTWEIAVLGSLIGLSLYVSVYTWSFLGVLLLLMLGYTLWQRKFMQSLRIFLTGILALAYSIPFIISFLQARAHADYPNVLESLDVMNNHSIELGLWLLVLLVVPILLWPKRLAESRLFFIFCGAALFIVLNQHVLTGFYLQPGHYHWYITKPLVGIILALAGAEWIRRWTPRHIPASLCVLAILALFAHGALAQKNFYQKHTPEAREAQAYVPLFEYLRQESRATILANPTLSIYAAIYTTADVPKHPYQIFYLSGSNDLGQALTIGDKKNTSSDPITTGLIPVTTIEDRFVIYRLP